MTKEDLEEKLAETLGIYEGEKDIAFNILVNKASETLNVDEAVKINGLGVFQLKKDASVKAKTAMGGAKIEKKYSLIYSPLSEEFGAGAKNLFLKIDVQNKRNLYEFDDSIFDLGVNKPLIPVTENLQGVLDSDTTGIVAKKMIEEKIEKLFKDSEQLENFDLWDDYFSNMKTSAPGLEIIQDEDVKDDFDPEIIPDTDFLDEDENEDFPMSSEVSSTGLEHSRQAEEDVIRELLRAGKGKSVKEIENISAIQQQDAISSEEDFTSGLSADLNFDDSDLVSDDDEPEEIDDSLLENEFLDEDDFNSDYPDDDDALLTETLLDNALEREATDEDDEVELSDHYKNSPNLEQDTAIEELLKSELLENTAGRDEETDFDEGEDEIQPIPVQVTVAGGQRVSGSLMNLDVDEDDNEEMVQQESIPEVIPEPVKQIIKEETVKVQENTPVQPVVSDAFAKMPVRKKSIFAKINPLFVIIPAVVIINLIAGYFVFFSGEEESHEKPVKTEHSTQADNKIEESATQENLPKTKVDTPSSDPTQLKMELGEKPGEKPINVDNPKLTLSEEKNNPGSGASVKLSGESKAGGPMIREIPKDEKVPNTNFYFDGSKYNVQVSSWKSLATAEKETARLRNGGYDAFIVKTNLQSLGVWYRVKIGSFNTAKEAEEFWNQNKNKI